jgi:hypothetical protein
MGRGYREPCSRLFKELEILTLASQYVFSLLLFVDHNKGCFTPNSVCNNFNTKHKNYLHVPHSSLTVEKEGSFLLWYKHF